MNAAPPASAPARPRSRQAQKIASWVEAGPGSRLHVARASSNSRPSSQPRRSTHSSRSSRMWVGGPPNPMQPIRPHSRRIVSRPGGSSGGRRRGGHTIMMTGVPDSGAAMAGVKFRLTGVSGWRAQVVSETDWVTASAGAMAAVSSGRSAGRRGWGRGRPVKARPAARQASGMATMT